MRVLLAGSLAAGAWLASPVQAGGEWTASAQRTAGAGSELVLRSLSMVGVRYRRGGNSPETGLDCSGLVQLVFRDTLGLVLPRRSEEMSRAGASVAREHLEPGDLVFFNTLRRAFSHVGIYIGDNRFVHAPSSGGRVRVESIDSRYWTRRFNGARRVADVAQVRGVPDSTQPVVAALVPVFDTSYLY